MGLVGGSRFVGGGLPDAMDALSTILAGGTCLSFVSCERVRAFVFGHYLFAKLGVNFGIHATSRAMQQFNVWLATIRPRTCSSVGQGEA